MPRCAHPTLALFSGQVLRVLGLGLLAAAAVFLGYQVMGQRSSPGPHGEHGLRPEDTGV